MGSLPSFCAETVGRELLLKMLRREQQLRDSKDIQAQYDAFHVSGVCSPDSIEMDLQRKVLCEFGFSNADHSLALFWQVPSVWKERLMRDKELRDSVVYLRYRHLFAKDELRVGVDAFDVPVHNPETLESVSLLSLCRGDRPLVVIAGSSG